MHLYHDIYGHSIYRLNPKPVAQYLGQPPTRKETFNTEHIKTSLLPHFIINKTYLIQNFITTHVY